MKWALIVIGSEAVNTRREVVVPAGTEWVVIEEFDNGATGQMYNGTIPPHAILFNSPEEALEYGTTWIGHPWWMINSGQFRTIAICEQDEYQNVYEGLNLPDRTEANMWGCLFVLAGMAVIVFLMWLFGPGTFLGNRG